MSIVTPPLDSHSQVQDKSLGHLLYGLMSAFPLFFIPVLMSLWLNIIQRNIPNDSLLFNHLRWQKVSIIGLASAFLVGYLSTGFWFSVPCYLLGMVWFSYRIFKGWLSLHDGFKV
ncbi:hypothetical protein ACFOD0_07220 [Shewanella intestini]|uniref:DUF4870 domain-containing protein n=1 Tax=Shewanella intestini TaxID=2017544 RepID=A0ABS5I041_9GAMM|nr:MULTISPECIES: hypothetical protein [Shewanella]MBR9726665.1 hypothetical protein [Shewanella intestini]MRG34769.1 hypothetical protein [Shewanella sp. XMDDZSB0408]